ncbi:helix-turn-helix domain-containing protein [Paracoccus sp. MA]|uniref:S24 family peptidase n=1 Tax=Paracoccus sp. MA TaxID=2895796 RepID=UPI001E3C406F|nr:S24 family peptidase [Paracoccus sp. MA]UFM63654.1 helix-turn-helix domain-containing protein [Paracoccus sp. MA]
MAGIMGEHPHLGKGNFPIAASYHVGYFPHMEKQHLDAFVRGLKIAMDADGWKMKPLSLAAGMGESGVRDLFRNDSSPKVVNAYALASVLGRSIDELVRIGEAGSMDVIPARAVIAVAGQVGAGAKVELVDAYEKGDGIYHVACPPQISPKGIVAVEVVGDSMMPAYQPGSILFYSRDALGVPTEAIGKVCVCEDEDGKVWVKQVKVGREDGKFSLLSINPETENMHGVRLKWAAPVRLSLPPEFVQRVD